MDTCVRKKLWLHLHANVVEYVNMWICTTKQMFLYGDMYMFVYVYMEIFGTH